MRRRLPTFSELGRVMACPASHLLPHVYSTSDDAAAGIADHKALEDMANGNPVDAKVEKRLRPVLEAHTFDMLTNMLTEQAFVLNERDAARLGSVGREYGEFARYCFCGTVDVIGCTIELPVVLDWKTGDEVTSVYQNWQMRAAAVAMSEWWRSDKVTARIVYTRTNRRDECTFDALDLAMFRVELWELPGRLEKLEAQGGPYDVTEGEHCKYCPAFNACPAKTSMLQKLKSWDQTTSTVYDGMPLEDIGREWAWIKEAGRALARLEESIKEHAARERIPLPNGKVLGIVESSRTSVDSDALAELARSLGATDEQVAACTKTSKFAVTREFKPKEEGK